jgi:Domain of unknown function (DUF4412)
MRIACCVIFALGTTLAAHADFSYTATVRNPVDTEASQPYRSAPGATAQTVKYYLKGQKMKIDNGNSATIVDFETKTITAIDNSQKTFFVAKFAQAAKKSGNVEATVDLKETGQRKTINGYNATEALMTMEFDSPQGSIALKMQLEMEIWFSPDVPGSEEWRAFLEKNRDRFLVSALNAGANSRVEQAMAAGLQRKIATLRGVPVLQVIRVKPVGNDPQTAQWLQGMEKERALLEWIAQQGEPQAAAAQLALAQMGATTSDSKALFEITQESSGFSTSTIPDSLFAIPAGYQRK